MLTAVSSAVARSANVGWVPSTTMILQSGHAAETIETSRVSSTPHPNGSALGNGDGLPCWLTIRRHPLAVVHGGSPYCLRYVARSDARCGVLKASTIATVWPLPPLVTGSLYADSMAVAPTPLGVVSAAGTRLPAAFSASARFTAVCGAYNVRQRGVLGRTTGHARRIDGAAAAAAGTAAVSVPAAVSAAPAAMAILLILMWLLPGLVVGTNCRRIRRESGGQAAL